MIALDITAEDRPGVLHAISEAISKAGVNIHHISTGERRRGRIKVYIELDTNDRRSVAGGIESVSGVSAVSEVPTFSEIYGKRLIIVGGGAQVAEVAKGAISEADRHNIRGEKISVDTVPLVGEEKIAKAVRAVARLSRAEALVIAGAMMGGEIKKAVEDVRDLGLVVVSLNMAGSAKEAADLVVTDPVQAGVMAVMAIADTAEFDIAKQRGKSF